MPASVTLHRRGERMPVDINIMVGGEAGQGIQVVGLILAKSFARGDHPHESTP